MIGRHWLHATADEVEERLQDPQKFAEAISFLNLEEALKEKAIEEARRRESARAGPRRTTGRRGR